MIRIRLAGSMPDLVPKIMDPAKWSQSGTLISKKYVPIYYIGTNGNPIKWIQIYKKTQGAREKKFNLQQNQCCGAAWFWLAYQSWCLLKFLCSNPPVGQLFVIKYRNEGFFKVDLMTEGATLAPANKKGNSGGRLRLRKTDKKRVAIQSSRGIQKGDSFN